MTQQERIIQSAEEHIVCFSRNGRGWGKNFRAGFECAVQYTLENLWVASDEEKPKSCELVFAALLDVKTESYQYYVGWYNETQNQWFLADYGYCFEVSYWMPIQNAPLPKL